jgi:NodT family efflux transporter outer membrane factor (OMF) lipoprotein
MRARRTKFSLTQTTMLLLSGTLVGCTVGPHYHSPAPPTVGSYTREPVQATVQSPGTGGTVQRFTSGTDIPAQWWMLFRSPALDQMVREALSNSPTLLQASDRLTEAQDELSARTGATKYPTVTGNASAESEQVNLKSFGVPFPNPKPFSLLNGSVAVSYALDLFGANRRLIESLDAQVAYESWQMRAARLMLAGNVVSATIRQAELRSQIEISRKMLDTQNKELAISEKRYQAGGVALSDVESQRAAVAQTKAELPPLEQQLAAINDQIALLMGKTPAEAQVESIHLDDLKLPRELPLSVPSSLVRQRPDILAAESLVHKASANVGIATANLYPQITLSGDAGGVGTEFSNGGGVWNIEASLAQPLYNGGALRAEKREALANYDEAGSAYSETVLQAFQEVADVLGAIEHDAETLQFRNEAENEAEKNYRIASQRYKAGGISEFALLDVQRQWLQATVLRNNSVADRFRDSATLFQALGGGWWNESKSTSAGAGAAKLP